MKKQFQKLASFAAMVAIATLAFSSCSKDDSSSNESDFKFSEVDGVYHMSGYISDKVTLESDKQYHISGPVIVMDGGTLTVPAGQVITAEAEFSAYILVTRGGKMYVNGTSSDPVVFTCIDTDSKWGGLIVNGKAPVSGSKTSGNEGSTEISSGYKYGGTDTADNSGSFTYMVLDRTGQQSSGSKEHNGLTLNGVGNGTLIEDVYITNGSDDGVEFFGGSVNVTRLLVVDSDDDMFDFTEGYTGTLKDCYGIWTTNYLSTEGDPSGVEADGNLDGETPDDYNQSDFKITNMTIDNRSINGSSKPMDVAINVRRGAKAKITNALLTGTGTVTTVINLVKGSAGAADAANGTAIDLTVGNQIVKTNDLVAGNNTYTITDSTNNGCETSNFDWTGFNFTAGTVDYFWE